MNENTEKKLATIGYVSLAGRLLMAAGCGWFVRNVAKPLVRDVSFPKKLGIWAGALCTAWALGHAVDCYWDSGAKILTDAVYRSEAFNVHESTEEEE